MVCSLHIHVAYGLWGEAMWEIKEILFRKWLNFSSGENQESQTDLDESEADDDEYVIDLPDGTKYKIPEMPPSRPHWG